jgi:hypothetical protein
MSFIGVNIGEPFSSFGLVSGGAPPVSPWILDSGNWDDFGIWKDGSLWDDGGVGWILLTGTWNDIGVWYDVDTWNDS